MKVEPADLSKLLSLSEYKLHIHYDCDTKPYLVEKISFTKGSGWMLHCDDWSESLKDLELLINYEEPGVINVYTSLGEEHNFRLVLQKAVIIKPSCKELEMFLT